jgi:deoxyribonuclease IV
VPAHERAVERGCEAMQVFNQSPRMWRPTRWKPDDVAQFLELRRGSPIRSVVIHAVYLINPATKDREMRRKSAVSLIHALRMGDEIRADGVVLHPGSTVGEPHDEALPRVGEMLKHALAESDRCRLLLENTAGAGNTLGRSFEELRECIDLSGGDKRIGVCLDSCHLYASGYDVTERKALDAVLRQVDELIGLDRLRALHVNDSAAPLGSNRDRHANIGEGLMGEELGVFLSHPKLQRLPVFLETPGADKHGPDADEVRKLRELHARWAKGPKRKPKRTKK